MAERFRLAIDTGGTFTDFVLEHIASGEQRFYKTLSTPDSPAQAINEGVTDLLSRANATLAQVDEALVATTVATNAILERCGAETALITTAGFRDVLIIGRAKRYDTYDLYLRKPRPLIPRRRIFEITERMGSDGAVLEPLDIAALERLGETMGTEGIESVAVSFLNAYTNPEHELQATELISRLLPAVFVCAASDISPKIREYERTSTAVANAYVRPLVERFLSDLEGSLRAQGFLGTLHVMQSNGGLLSPSLARRYPVRIIESGPAAGVVLSGHIGEHTETDRVLSFDMGGTTAKLGAVENGVPAVTDTFEVDGINLRQWSGLPLNISAVELIEIGAGGGSIAKARLGMIEVGPQSAGAEPGPVCYGRGGDRPTITDANVILGYIDPARFAAGRVALDLAGARRTVELEIAEPLGLDVESAALGIHAIANANMERAMRSISIERGRDPRDYALVAFGGAGPLHACELARELGIPRVIIPRGSGVGSAVGLLRAEPRFGVSITQSVVLDEDAIDTLRAIDNRLLGLVEPHLDDMHSHQAPAYLRSGLARYRGQGYEIRIDFPHAGHEQNFGSAYVEDLRSLFHQRYRELYGYAQSDQPIEITDWQLDIVFPRSIHATETTLERREDSHDAEAIGSRRHPHSEVPTHQAYFLDTDNIGRWFDTPIYERDDLRAMTESGSVLVGPAIVADDESTLLIPPGDSADLGPRGEIVVTIGAHSW